jgi:fructose-bisphosphate aldolase, class I
MRMPDQTQLDRFREGAGFLAALDQSGGSTPHALSLYGISPSSYSSPAEMFDLIHAERERVIADPAFSADRILAAILFQDTLHRRIHGLPTAQYLLQVKGILPFLKIDQGLQPQKNGVQLMRPISDLEATLEDARTAGAIGTKARSVIHSADASGVRDVVAQQFEVARGVLGRGLLPIIEPEVSIDAPDKAGAEVLLKDAILVQLDALTGTQQVAVKISLPSVDDFYLDLIEHPRVARVVALSGGYSQDEADRLLSRNHRLVASFSRALLEGLSVHQDAEEFSRRLAASIEAIYDASIAPDRCQCP